MNNCCFTESFRKPAVFTTAWVLVFAACCSCPATTIDHSNMSTATNAPMEIMEKVGMLRWFFTHASVGGNMVTGMNELRLTNTNRYRLAIYNYNGIDSDTDYHGAVATAGSYGGNDYRAASLSTTTNGMIYECPRPNPPWDNTIVCFSNSVITSGWRFPRINVAMDKFCWIDPDANPTNYCSSMSALENTCPETLFVYLTMPLSDETAGSDNDQRNSFNQYVRSYCASNSKWLLDVADIEAWGTNGLEQTYISGSTTNQYMATEYAVNAGGGDYHLNSTGRRHMALGWYALAASLFTQDRDGDRMYDGDELMAGTCPTQSNSVLGVKSAEVQTNGIVLCWDGVANRTYGVDATTNLLPGNGWSNILSNISAGSPNCVTVPVQNASSAYYRITVEQ